MGKLLFVRFAQVFHLMPLKWKKEAIFLEEKIGFFHPFLEKSGKKSPSHLPLSRAEMRG
ncbi:MAG: hypothetical protein IJY71_03725 [Clostridia bacterium]|nr:hypothetical protein [Clostridia bacterium]